MKSATPSVLVNYRRDDSWGLAGRIYDRLVAEYGSDQVFRDVDSIPPGTNFAKTITELVARCDAVIVVIGKDWLTSANPDGRCRLDDPDDWVRIEIGTALERGITIVPVLAPGVPMPREKDLPEPLRGLALHNAIRTSDTHFASDLELLMSVLPRMRRRSRRLALVAATVVGAALLVGGYASASRAISDGRVVRRLTETASSLAARGDFRGAWNSANDAVAVRPTHPLARRAVAEIGMAWLRNARYVKSDQVDPTGPKSFSELVDPILPRLHEARATAHGRDAADLDAHVGWAYFLKAREGVGGFDIGGTYTNALQIDPENTYAHAMLGHWLIVEHGVVSDALNHFNAAVGSGRDRPFVRRMQLAALRWRSSPDATAELIRTAHQMRVGGEELSRDARREIRSTAYFMEADSTLERLESILPPSEHLATLRWLLAGVDAASEASARFFEARLTELSGEHQYALTLYAVLLGSHVSVGGGEAVRDGFARCLGKASSPDAGFETIVRLLQSTNSSIRSRTVSSVPLAGVTPGRVAPFLLAALSDEDSEVRRSARSAFGDLGAAVVPDLIEALSSSDPNRVDEVARTLGEMKSNASPAVPALAAMLTTTNKECRATIIESLGNLGADAKPAVPRLMRLLRTSHERGLVLDVAQALGRIGIDDVEGAETTRSVLRTIPSPEADVSGMGTARTYDLLAEIGPPARAAIPTLILALRDERVRVPVAAFHALTRMGADARPAIPALLGALRRTEKVHLPSRAESLIELVESIAEHGDPDSIRDLASIAEGFEELELPDKFSNAVRNAVEKIRRR